MIAKIDLKSVGGRSSVENTFTSRPIYLKSLALKIRIEEEKQTVST